MGRLPSVIRCAPRSRCRRMNVPATVTRFGNRNGRKSVRKRSPMIRAAWEIAPSVLSRDRLARGRELRFEPRTPPVQEIAIQIGTAFATRIACTHLPSRRSEPSSRAFGPASYPRQPIAPIQQLLPNESGSCWRRRIPTSPGCAFECGTGGGWPSSRTLGRP